MKTLHEILHDVMILLADPRVEQVVIARGDHDPLDARSAAFQIRLDHEMIAPGLSGYACEARAWLGEQWSTWREHRGWLGGRGFDVRDVLATDWRIIS